MSCEFNDKFMNINNRKDINLFIVNQLNSVFIKDWLGY